MEKGLKGNNPNIPNSKKDIPKDKARFLQRALILSTTMKGVKKSKKCPSKKIIEKNNKKVKITLDTVSYK